MSVRAFVSPASRPVPGAKLDLDEAEAHYLEKVRRLRVGDTVELLDGAGGRWIARVVGLGRRRVSVEVGEPIVEPPVPERILLLGLPDPPATLETLTGASELGVSEVVLVRCARSQGRTPNAARVERVLRAAQRQCGRPRPPSLRGLDRPWPLERALAHRAELPGMFGWAAMRGATEHRRLGLPRLEQPAGGARHAWTPAQGLRLLVGPEGGLTPGEVELIRDAGFVALGLGPWLLRTPTAALALAARFAPGSLDTPDTPDT